MCLARRVEICYLNKYHILGVLKIIIYMVSLGLAQFRTGHIRTRSQMRYHVSKFVWRYSVDGKLKNL